MSEINASIKSERVKHSFAHTIDLSSSVQGADAQRVARCKERRNHRGARLYQPNTRTHDTRKLPVSATVERMMTTMISSRHRPCGRWMDGWGAYALFVGHREGLVRNVLLAHVRHVNRIVLIVDEIVIIKVQHMSRRGSVLAVSLWSRNRRRCRSSTGSSTSSARASEIARRWLVWSHGNGSVFDQGVGEEKRRLGSCLTLELDDGFDRGALATHTHTHTRHSIISHRRRGIERDLWATRSRHIPAHREVQDLAAEREEVRDGLLARLGRDVRDLDGGASLRVPRTNETFDYHTGKVARAEAAGAFRTMGEGSLWEGSIAGAAIVGCGVERLEALARSGG